MKHLQSLAEAVRDPLLTQLVLACADQNQVRQQCKRNPLMPSVKMVLTRIWEGLETEGQMARWTLDVLELYYRHQPRALWQDKVIGELFALHLPCTNELQQIHWIKLYLAGPSSTAIEQALISIIEASPTLQSRLLLMEGRRAEVLALVAIGPDRRLKEARRRYLIQPTRCHPFRNIYDMAELVQKYGTHLISTGCIEREGEWDSMVLLTPGRMSTFGHILALASLFHLRPPFTLPPSLTHNLLGFANHWIGCFWTGSMLAELFDRYEIRPDRVVPVSQLRCIDELPVLQYIELSLGTSEEDEEVTVYMGEVVERLERAMAAAHRILLPFITWRQVQLPLYIL